ncbi:molybdopterin-dependent oxidoreductase [Isoptericola sp. NEAU-Y5]|uniref:Molybdopterin-dependent oxidoreductase n=1 Tax=Isoptericola luteus TaxID=2879484 RepID=A0ABS7ZE13_9MICO|nr:molybdopterin-dependent oxidoreductase [Isoptericola sp. NEAU-Y5]MCA5893276.1 molybdopterin-dependent oxidoreductase [Isoptericola sp. NEAU-Y5]
MTTEPGVTPHAGAPRARTGWWAALAGVVAAGAGLALAELLAAFVDPASSPVLAGGAAVVDAVPGWLKDLAVAWFGTADKAVLLGTMGVVLAAGAALAGWLELRRPPAGAVLLGAVGVLAAVVAAARPAAGVLWAVPSLVGVGVGVLLLRRLVRELRPRDRTPLVGLWSGSQDAPDRRTFLLLAGLTAAGAVVALGASRAVSAGSRAVDAVRRAIRLPAAAKAAPAVPAGAELGIDGLDPYVTPNESFYRIDTALRVPQVAPDDWSLTVTGLVDEPFTITWDDLLALPLEEHFVTLACVSNQVGGDLIGNALWLGHPVRELLARARPRAGADMVLSRSTDGFTAGTPLAVLQEADRACLLAVGMNGEPLPAEHGFPARLVVPGLYGYVSATKWVTELKVTRFADEQGYWTPRGWSALGPVKLSSRIDVPRPGDDLAAGRVTLAGVAWAQHTGIAGVEVRVDDGAWVAADLADTVGPDTWRQWRLDWDAPPGDHLVAVRATDTDGVVQVEALAPPAPDGATGWHTIELTIT